MYLGCRIIIVDVVIVGSEAFCDGRFLQCADAQLLLGYSVISYFGEKPLKIERNFAATTKHLINVDVFYSHTVN